MHYKDFWRFAGDFRLRELFHLGTTDLVGTRPDIYAPVRGLRGVVKEEGLKLIVVCAGRDLLCSAHAVAMGG